MQISENIVSLFLLKIPTRPLVGYRRPFTGDFLYLKKKQKTRRRRKKKLLQNNYAKFVFEI